MSNIKKMVDLDPHTRCKDTQDMSSLPNLLSDPISLGKFLSKIGALSKPSIGLRLQ